MQDRINTIKSLLDKIANYNRIIEADNFESDTVDDIRGNAKDIADEIKTEVDTIKVEIDLWS